MTTSGENTTLLPFNTFGIDVKAARIREVRTVQELQQALKSIRPPVLILGGGSNILFTHDWPGTVILNRIRGIEQVRRFKNRVWVRIGAGEVWHQFVEWAVRHQLGGVENLSLIPGLVGAAPVQNIGAYGVELKDIFIRLEAIEMATGKRRVFNRKQCRFGYRESIFKHTAKGKYCITTVTLSLSTDQHQLRTEYGAIQQTLDEMGIGNPGIADISRAVMQIRSSKLPDPARIGNCGSFFKNPEVGIEVLERIREHHPAVPHYPLPDQRVKIPAGWLIEQCGWKGKRVGNTGCYDKQALVLVNYGGATGSEVRQLAHDIIDSVAERFGIRLEPEVNIL
ncbi:MAG: UDP-N-acetylmuramate dehydrogenase [Bacteroidetes bacterium]|nr:MAG: UDP-N-acetylmuramate dehydrogenase [Bacteroidota bacterium]